MNSLGIEKPRRMTRVVVALSGGVDSAATAAMLCEEGYEVIGVTMLLHDAADQAIMDAKRIAAVLSIRHHVLDLRTRFKSCVIDRFAASYASGETPNPCAFCNQRIKFGDLFVAARELGGDILATGHYARLTMDYNTPESIPQLCKAIDDTKDQSYFLFGIMRENLPFVRFPLGEKTKEESRAIAARLGLDFVATKQDSQDICFVPDGNYGALVSSLRPEAAKSGDIVDQSGQVMGRHEGIMNYTIGQRRGLDLGNRKGDQNDPLFVLGIDAEQSKVIVGPRQALDRQEVFIRDVNWIAEDVPQHPSRAIQVKLRSTQKPVTAIYNGLEHSRGHILLDTPVSGSAAGQAAVIYQGDRVLGGGWIESHDPR